MALQQKGRWVRGPATCRSMLSRTGWRRGGGGARAGRRRGRRWATTRGRTGGCCGRPTIPAWRCGMRDRGVGFRGVRPTGGRSGEGWQLGFGMMGALTPAMLSAGWGRGGRAGHGSGAARAGVSGDSRRQVRPSRPSRRRRDFRTRFGVAAR